ncbi:hypothetical protein BHM03_00048559 [Ensete ventricosum]|nr:hypothetical protein BHM03_00048559 [Ensete ventricosum]
MFMQSQNAVPVHTGIPKFGWYGSVTIDFDHYRVCSSYHPVQSGPRTARYRAVRVPVNHRTGTYRPYRVVQGGPENLVQNPSRI